MLMRSIGIDITAALAQSGGIGRYTRELVLALAAENENPAGKAFQLKLFSAKTKKVYHSWDEGQGSASNVSGRRSGPPCNDFSRLDSPAVSYHRAWLNEQWLYRLWYRLRLPLPVQLFIGELALFHSPDFVLPPVSGGIPTLLTVHDLSFVHFPETFPETLVAYLNRAVPWSIRRATHVLADSQATSDDLQAIWHVPADKISVLLSGVNARFHKMPEKDIHSVRRKYGLDDAPYVLTVGTVQPRKNYEMLVRAWRSVGAAFPYSLAIAGGRGWLADKLVSSIDAQQLAGRVRILGFVDDDDLPALYSGAELFLFPSLYEGFGLPVLEAMACGIPVISSNSSSLPEVAGDACLLISPEDQGAWTAALLALLADETRRGALATAGRQQALRFTWEAAARQLLSLYATLIG
jgi:glycosyltransferase involved in cell wall biosynthesis